MKTTTVRRLVLVPASLGFLALLLGPLLGLQLQLLLGLVVGFGVAWVLQGIAAPRAEATYRRRAVAEGVAAELTAQQIHQAHTALTYDPTPGGFVYDGTAGAPQHRITVKP
jgi:hypothetical protein